MNTLLILFFLCFFVCVCFRKVDDEHKETAGAMMALFLAIGLGLGGALSFAVTESI